MDFARKVGKFGDRFEFGESCEKRSRPGNLIPKSIVLSTKQTAAQKINPCYGSM